MALVAVIFSELAKKKVKSTAIVNIHSTDKIIVCEKQTHEKTKKFNVTKTSDKQLEYLWIWL